MLTRYGAARTARGQPSPPRSSPAFSETLLQTPPAVALLGDETAYTGPNACRADVGPRLVGSVLRVVFYHDFR